MRRILKWTGIAAAGIVVILIATMAVVYLIANSRFNRTYDFIPQTVSAAADSAAIARGEHIGIVRGCVGCHGQDLAGGPVIESPPVAMLYATNLTSGEGGRAQLYKDDMDWVRAVRHGIGPDNRPLKFMPSQEYNVLSDPDMSDLLAYLKSRPPVDRELPQTKIGPLGRILYLAGEMPLIPAELIDHEAPRPEPVPPGETIAYGAYLATGCMGCHGEHFSGGKIPGTPPDFPLVANITPDDETGIGKWTEEDFFRALREGIRPDGTELDEFMPVRETSKLTDAETRALYLHFMSLEPREEGNR